MACTLCGQPANRHLEGCPLFKKRDDGEEDLTAIVGCPACHRQKSKMHSHQFGCEACKQAIYWCGECGAEENAKNKHDQRVHAVVAP